MDERALTWTALLAHWMEVARAAVSLPEGEEGDRWRRSMAPAITLHAVTFALRDLLALPLEERPVARDRAAILVAEACAALDETWRGEVMPESLQLLRHDASVALDESEWAGAVELVWRGPGELVAPSLVDPASLEEVGTLCVAAPGTILVPGEPVAWWVGRGDLSLDGCERIEVVTPRQVYRVLDDAGRIVRDEVAPMHEDLPSGMPLLTPLLENGVRVGSFVRAGAEWEALQRAAMPEGGIVARFHEGEG